MRLHDDLASRSTHSRHIIAQESSHLIPIDEPGLIVDAIQSIVEVARGDKPWTK